MKIWNDFCGLPENKALQEENPMCFSEMDKRFKKWWASWESAEGLVSMDNLIKDEIDVGGLWHEKNFINY